MKINVERMRYKNDTLSFWFCMFALIADIVQFIIIYSNSYLTAVTGQSGFKYYLIGIDIIVNILFMLFAFYVGEELKTYHIKWAVAPIIMGVIQLVRIPGFPKTMTDFEYITAAHYRTVVICLILSAVFMFAAAVNSLVRCTLLNRFLKAEASEKQAK